MGDCKVFLVHPPLDKRDWDLGDLVAIAPDGDEKMNKRELLLCLLCDRCGLAIEKKLGVAE